MMIAWVDNLAAFQKEWAEVVALVHIDIVEVDNC